MELSTLVAFLVPRGNDGYDLDRRWREQTEKIGEGSATRAAQSMVSN